MVRIGCKDSWGPLHGSSSTPDGFAPFTPDLKKTPPTSSVCPPDRHQVNERLRSEETRVNSAAKMAELRNLRDEVYESREDPFHWNLHEAFELHGKHRTVGNVRSPSDADTDSDDGISTAADTIVRTDLEYEVNDFIAVRGEDCTSEMPFWLAKVREIHKNPDGVIFDITVQWYEVYNGGDCLSGRYEP